MQLKVLNEFAKLFISYAKEKGGVNSKDLDLFLLICYKTTNNYYISTENKYYTEISFDFIKETLYLTENVSYTTIFGKLTKLLKLMIQTQLERDIIADKNVIAVKGSIITTSPLLEIIEKKKEMSYLIEVSKYLMPFLTNIVSCFTILELKEIFSLQSKYAKTLYRLMKESAYKNKLEIDINRLKKFFELENKQIKFFHFERDYLKRAVSEINKKYEEGRCSFSLSYEKNGGEKGKIVKGIIFKVEKYNEISENVKKAIENTNKNIYISKAKAIDERYILSLITNYDEEKVIKALKETYTTINSEITAKNKKAYFKKIVENKIIEMKSESDNNVLEILGEKENVIENIINEKKSRIDILICYVNNFEMEKFDNTILDIINRELRIKKFRETTLKEISTIKELC